MWYNPLVTWLLRSPLHGLMSGNTLLLTYTGRKSGRSFTFPISYARVGDSLWLITHKSKSWWRNVRSGAPVVVRVRGQDARASAAVAEVEPAALLEAMLKVYRGMPRALAEQRLPAMVLVQLKLAPNP